ncbi:NAD(P)-binding protein [Cupriavidus basilensis]
MNASAAPGNQIVIIGAGVAGMCTDIRLRQAGIDTFVVFGNAGTVGGSWRDSTVSGRGCDDSPRLHRFSFAPKPGLVQRILATVGKSPSVTSARSGTSAAALIAQHLD